ncbi:hypothetical protein KZX06_09695 [Micrococcus sp. EYE_162]|uniref:hypothetical protein n=1 Tax=unclassified Micrococcus TaxID=2620948 RepID=UPI002002E3F3|nr:MULTISPECIES: hypothetical protein [unclassified Micrococcus]MCK6096199.1 hypothetical protein [Micrococcus sp. EYE_212]MCK6172290.1 hypothetical protein [Micrococcus sp. EYE_162]
MTTWNEGRGITVALAGLGEGGREGVDVTPAQARQLAEGIFTVTRELDMLATPEVERVARELASRRRLLVTDLLQAADENGISAAALTEVVATYREGRQS